MTNREAIFGILGIAIGCVAGIFGSKKYYEKKYIDAVNDELDKIREEEEYTDLADEYDSKEKNDKKPVDEVSYKKGFDKQKEKKKEDTAYDGMYRAKKLAEDAAESVDGGTDNGDESFEEYDRRVTKNQPPRIISEEALGEVPGYYDHIDLFYYTRDDILTDDADNVLEDRGRFLGSDIDCWFSDFCDSDDRTMIIRNFELSTVYEIQKFDSSFEELE